MSGTSGRFSSHDDRRIVSALNRVHCMKAIDVSQVSTEELARFVNLSESRFRALFTSRLGITPARYMKALRLRQADVLVRESFMTIKEVMAATGFNDESHFLRDYKDCYGCCPSVRRGKRFGR
jgi:transcriptional regulator GlxA family with amidase domain